MPELEIIQRWTMEASLTTAELALLLDPSFESATSGVAIEQRGQFTYLRMHTPDVRGVVDTFFSVGKAALSQGNFSRAVGGYGVALRAHLSGLGMADPDTAKHIGWLATALWRSGELTEALALQKTLLQDERCRVRDAMGSMMVRATFAHMLLDGGQAGRAHELLEGVLKEATVRLGADARFTLSIRSDLSASLLSLGDAPAAQWHARAAESAIRYKFPEDEIGQLVAQSNLASAHFARGDFPAAKRLEEDALEKFHALVGPEHHRTLLAEQNLALTLKRLGELGSAERLARHATETLIRHHGFAHHDTLRTLDSLLSIWLRQETPQLGLPFALTLLPILAELASFGRIMFRVAARLAVCVGEALATPECSPEDRELALRALDAMPAGSVVLCEEAQLLSFDTDEIALDDFLAFHDWWSKIAALNCSSKLLQAVAPLHGIHAWSAAVECFQDTSTPVPAIRAARQEFIHARDALNRLRSQLAAVWSDERSSTEKTQETSVLLEKERLAIDSFRQARTDLSTVDAAFAALSFDSIQAQLPNINDLLHRDEVLILTVSLGRGPGAPAVALVMRADGQAVLAPLVGFGELAAGRDQGSRGSDIGMRGGGTTGDRGIGQAPPRQTLAAMRSSIRTTFWQPLSDALAHLRVHSSALTSVHVVTAPIHHSIALESGNESIPAFYYCGLPAFIRLRRKNRMDSADRGALLAYDAAWGAAQPIPFVRAEAQLAEMLLSCDGEVEQSSLHELPRRSAARRLLIGCHGEIGGTAQARHGNLLLDAETGRSLSVEEGADVGARYAEIVVSSCLAGLVGKARWGDALGLIPLWQTCSVATIVACVAPVHDFYMPLLTTLYLHHRLLRAEPSIALRRAKSDLISGDWPDPFCHAVRETYRREMAHVLIRGAQSQHTLVCARVVLGWPLAQAIKDELRSHLLSADKDNDALRARFSDASNRSAWIDACLAMLIDERHSHTTSADPVHQTIGAALEHICAYTVCYGGPSAMSEPNEVDQA